MRKVLPIVLLLCSAAACTSSRREPEPIPEPATTTEPSPAGPYRASLLRRLGEAIDGYRDGRPRYVIAGLRFPHPVAGVVERVEEADSLVQLFAADPAEYQRFGPYIGVEDSAEVLSPKDEVTRVLVYTRGSTEPKVFSGATVDALFWSLPAFDKFIAPYLTLVYGPRYAFEERERYRRGESRLARSKVIPHYRNSF